MKCPFIRKSKIDTAVRAKLEDLGADVVRSKLTWTMNVRTLAQQDEQELLGDGLWAPHKEMQEWFKEKAAGERCLMIAATIAAGAAAIISLLAWLFPRSASLL
jgi:hypothetical protein